MGREGVRAGEGSLGDRGEADLVAVGEGEGDRAGAGGAHRGAGGATEGVGVVLAVGDLVAEADEDDLVDLEAGHGRDRRRGGDLRADVEDRQDGVEVLGRGLGQCRGRLRAHRVPGAGHPEDEGSSGPGGEGAGTEDQRGHDRGTFRVG